LGDEERERENASSDDFLAIQYVCANATTSQVTTLGANLESQWLFSDLSVQVDVFRLRS